MEQLQEALRPRIKVQIALEDTAFFGPGPANLMRKIQQCGSVHRACEEMGLSYSKGRRLLRAIEAALGTPVVDCTQGGAGGGSAALTAGGETLLERYEEFERRVQRHAAEEFSALFPDGAGQRGESSCG